MVSFNVDKDADGMEHADELNAAMKLYHEALQKIGYKSFLTIVAAGIVDPEKIAVWSSKDMTGPAPLQTSMLGYAALVGCHLERSTREIINFVKEIPPEMWAARTEMIDAFEEFLPAEWRASIIEHLRALK